MSSVEIASEAKLGGPHILIYGTSPAGLQLVVVSVKIAGPSGTTYGRMGKWLLLSTDKFILTFTTRS